MEYTLREICSHFRVDTNIESYGNGHINDTYICRTDPAFILQRINTSIFKNPDEVMKNIIGVTSFLSRKIKALGGDPKRETMTVIKTEDGKSFYRTPDGACFRMYTYVPDTVTHETAETPEIFYSAAKAFGKFQRMLADYPADKLNETIIDFHNTPVRYEQFKEALKNNKSGRAATAEDEIKFVLDRESDAGIVVDALKDGRIPLRVTHNDTKLNNVLLDNKTGEGVCVIDLDTVMPGSLLYDYGDALRFGGSSGAEDERDLDKIYFKVENFTAFTRGFLEELTSITDAELELLPFSIKLMTLECGSRFLADYLNGDTYFKTAYPEHNLVRARTQFKLVRDIEDKYDELCRIVHEIAGR
mgnify:CR=1 FL=1